MPPRPFVNDALWRCLCPGFPPGPSPSALRIGTASLRNPRPQRTTHRQTRTHSAAAAPAPSLFSTQPHVALSPARAPPPRARNAREKERPALAHLPTHLLYETLRQHGAQGRFDDVIKTCNVLIKDRGCAPDKDMYAAVLHSFTSCVDGTAGKARKVLEEMGFWGAESSAGEGMGTGVGFGGRKIELDARGCENVLEVLAVHPDYLLRAEILEYMRERWFTLSDRGQGFVVAGLLRERLFEQALEMLEELCRKKVRVDEWVFSEAMWLLLEFGEVEEAFYVLGLKEGAMGAGTAGAAVGVKLSNALWGAMLDAAATQHLHDAARLVWTTQVQPGFLKPPTGTCLSVLSLASRHGDVQLATDVFRVLTERETSFNTHHYELLIATYLKANALSDALSVILIMTDANLKVDAGTCHPLYWHLVTTPTTPTTSPSGQEEHTSTPLHAFTLLQDLAAAGRRVPTAAVNTCIAASIASHALPAALDMYKALHTVCGRPNTETFNLLFRGCAHAGRKDLAMFLAAEMISLNLQPDRITYDRLILVCEQSGDVDDALNYFEEMRAADLRPRRGTYERLIDRLVEQGDERCVGVLRDYRESGEVVSKGAERRVRERFDIEVGDGIVG